MLTGLIVTSDLCPVRTGLVYEVYTSLQILRSLCNAIRISASDENSAGAESAAVMSASISTGAAAEVESTKRNEETHSEGRTKPEILMGGTL